VAAAKAAWGDQEGESGEVELEEEKRRRRRRWRRDIGVVEAELESGEPLSLCSYWTCEASWRVEKKRWWRRMRRCRSRSRSWRAWQLGKLEREP
jgi:hypothetical protein